MANSGTSRQAGRGRTDSGEPQRLAEAGNRLDQRDGYCDSRDQKLLAERVLVSPGSTQSLHCGLRGMPDMVQAGRMLVVGLYALSAPVPA